MLLSIFYLQSSILSELLPQLCHSLFPCPLSRILLLIHSRWIFDKVDWIELHDIYLILCPLILLSFFNLLICFQVKFLRLFSLLHLLSFLYRCAQLPKINCHVLLKDFLRSLISRIVFVFPFSLNNAWLCCHFLLSGKRTYFKMFLQTL